MDDHAAAFTRCWRVEGPRILAYARRHAGPDEATDVVAETFLIAWRRWDDVPDPPIGWLLRTAAGVMRNRRRGTRRRDDLARRAARLDQVAAAVADTAEAVVRRDEAVRRLAALSEEHREALLLTTWDGLGADEAAAVLGLRPATFRKRLSRARELLDRDPAESSGGPTPAARRTTPPTTLITRQEMS